MVIYARLSVFCQGKVKECFSCICHSVIVVYEDERSGQRILAGLCKLSRKLYIVDGQRFYCVIDEGEGYIADSVGLLVP